MTPEQLEKKMLAARKTAYKSTMRMKFGSNWKRISNHLKIYN